MTHILTGQINQNKFWQTFSLFLDVLSADVTMIQPRIRENLILLPMRTYFIKYPTIFHQLLFYVLEQIICVYFIWLYFFHFFFFFLILIFALLKRSPNLSLFFFFFILEEIKNLIPSFVAYVYFHGIFQHFNTIFFNSRNGHMDMFETQL